MIVPQQHQNEENRLKEFDGYSILDSLPEQEYDDITKLASQICDTPISLISLVDENRQWFKSKHGLNETETKRDFSFCAHAINDEKNIFIVKDSRLDNRFFDNPLVINSPNAIFYAGVPLITPNGFPLGTLCVIDHQPKELSENQLEVLKILSRQVIRLFELRKSKMLLENSKKYLELKIQESERLNQIAAHDLKAPLNNIISLSEILKSNDLISENIEVNEIVEFIQRSANSLNKLVYSILNDNSNEIKIRSNFENFKLNEFIFECIDLISFKENYQFNYKNSNSFVYSNRMLLQQIFINLISNAIKYNDKIEVIINIDSWEDENFYFFRISDNGKGIEKQYLDKIFDLNEVFSEKDRFGKRGNGIGLSTVKNLVNSLQGKIKVGSEVGKGSIFEFTVLKVNS